MTGKDFLNLLYLKFDFDYSNKAELLDSSAECRFKGLNDEELNKVFIEYLDYNCAPLSLYYLITENPFLKNNTIEEIESYISMLQMKSDKTDWSAEVDKFGFELLGCSNKRVLEVGVLVPTLHSYEGCISSKKIREFLKCHPGCYVDSKNSLEDDFSKEESELIKELEN